jgi:hypothetical protein
MSTAACIVALLSAIWIDYGWRPLAGGGQEYIIQVPPELIDTLSTDGIESYVPSGVGDIRRIRIVVGNETLPQTPVETPVEPPALGNGAASEAAPPDISNASQTDRGNGKSDTGGGEPRTTKYLGEPSSGDGDAGSEPSRGQESGVPSGVNFLGLDALSLAEVGLGVLAALVVFLVWTHLAMRARYRALLHQMHSR